MNHSALLGRDGSIPVSRVGFGCWRLAGVSVDEARERLEAAVAAGITLVDTADVYGVRGDGSVGAEQLLGQVFAKAPELRAAVTVATKGGIERGVPYNSSADHLVRACDASLRRLRVEAVDLYQVHRPDMLAHPAEVARALTTIVEAGKARAVGVSNYRPAQVNALRTFLDVPLAAHQFECSLLHLDPLYDGSLDQCMELSIAPILWSPLAGGRLFDSATDVDGRERKVASALDALASLHACTLAEIALAFLLKHPASPVVLVGTQRVDRLAAAARSVEVDLTRQEWYSLLESARVPV